jgi:peptidoglycan-associated lipoprotein
MKKLLAIMCTLLFLSACQSSMDDSAGGSWLDGDRSSTVGDQTDSVNVVYFMFDSSALSDGAKAKLREQAEEWKSCTNQPVLVVEGHCDKVGDSDYNLALGERRAYAAKRELEKHGIPSNMIETISYGKERPAVMDDDALNRRSVTIAIKN